VGTTVEKRSPRVAVVGAGMSGLCMGIKLKRAGIEDFTIYEKADAVGGTWRDNTYPGLSCDVPSRFYQYSFAPNPDWTHFFSPGAEIWRYFDRVAESYGLRDHLAFGKEVTSARFAAGRWRLRTADGEETDADFVVSACGVLHRPRVPPIKGLETFSGPAFHSARWDHGIDLSGKRVAVVGTGSTGVQIVCGLQDVAGRLDLFQRTAQWIFPARNRRYSKLARLGHRRIPLLSRLAYLLYEKLLDQTFFRAVVEPGWQRRLISGICRANLLTIRDPELRRKLTPDYEPMCKRLVASWDFYRVVQQPNVDVVTEAIERVEPGGIVTADGRVHEVDVLVLATGFDSHAYMRPMEVVGEGGLSLDDAWRDGPSAYRTVGIPGFPNFFMLMGPHSPVGNYSLVPIAEIQSRYVMRWIRMWQEGRVSTAAPTAGATAAFNQELRDAMPETIWVTGCQSWYLGKDGSPEVWPWRPVRLREMLEEPDLAEFDVRPAA
jgi:cation diffusion facilitator CzcD-associated flavoprotein CzcO